MSVRVVSDITIGSFQFEGVCDVRIKKSLHSFVDTATVIIPARCQVARESDHSDVREVEAASIFKAGDPVVINLGYDDDLREEFRGFVKRPNLKAPFEMECEGYSYQLSRTENYVKAWTSVTVKDILNYILKGTDIKVHPGTQDITLSPFRLNSQNAYEALEEIKKIRPVTVCFIDGDQLYVGTGALTQPDKAVNYWLGWNTVKDDQLKYRDSTDVKVYMSITYKDEKGKTHHTSTGERGGLEIKKDFKVRLTADQAKLLAKQDTEKYVYEGFEGRINCFLQPFCQPGYKAVIDGEKYQERTGEYLAEATEVIFGRGGGWRIVEIGKRLNKQR